MARFMTDTGQPVPAVTTAEMREIDRIAIESAGPNLFQMMENAGRNLATVILGHIGERRRAAKVLVLAGTGGNGGGGITAARHLMNHGVDVTVIVTDVGRLGDVPAAQLRVYRDGGGVVAGSPAVEGIPDVVVDAVIGYSLRGAPQGAPLAFVEQAAAYGAAGSTVVSLDVPSGLDSTTGAMPGAAVSPDVTVTLALPKHGLAAASGRLMLADIGIPTQVYRSAGVDVARSVFDHRYVIPIEAIESVQPR